MTEPASQSIQTPWTRQHFQKLEPFEDHEVRLTYDFHGTTWLGFKAPESPAWVNIPLSYARLSSVFQGITSIGSALGNADYIIVSYDIESRWVSKAALMTTNFGEYIEPSTGMSIHELMPDAQLKMCVDESKYAEWVEATRILPDPLSYVSA